MRKDFAGDKRRSNKFGPKRPPSRVPPPPPMYGGRPEIANKAPSQYQAGGQRRSDGKPHFSDQRPRFKDGERKAGFGLNKPRWQSRGEGGAQRYGSQDSRPTYTPNSGTPRPYGSYRERPTYNPSNRPFVGKDFNRKPRTPIQHYGSAPKTTSWNQSAEWYDYAVEKEGSYQKDLILPNLLRLLDLKGKESIADIACGQGFFSWAFSETGADVFGVDISPELIKIAKSKGTETDSGKNKKSSPDFSIAPAHNTELKTNKFDHSTIILAIQNIREFVETFIEASRLLKKDGTLHIVLNHPCFRIPKRSAWGFDSTKNIQFRRLDSYLSDSAEKIVMHPGNPESEATASFHRPLQSYMKALSKAGFAMTRLEEWISNRQSQPGARAEAENKARSEFPLFLYIQAKKI